MFNPAEDQTPEDDRCTTGPCVHYGISTDGVPQCTLDRDDGFCTEFSTIQSMRGTQRDECCWHES